MEYEKIINEAEMAALLHTCFFGFERAHGKLTGRGSRAILQYVVKGLPRILHHRDQHLVQEDAPLEENLARFNNYFSRSELFDSVELRREDEDKYCFVIEGCPLADGVHEILDPDAVCPFAIVAASVLYHLTGQDVSIQDSNYTDDGTTTRIEIIRQ